MEEPRTLRPQEIPRAAHVLSRAFYHDPFWRWLAPPDARYRQRLENAFAAQLRLLALPRGLVLSAPQLAGLALWSPPGTWDAGVVMQLRSLPTLLSVCGPARFPSRMRGLRQIQAMHPRAPHWYLQVLGVDPEERGRGWARRLLQPVLERCDREAMPCWLETAAEENLSLYRRFGFEVTDAIQLPAQGPSLWGMWRPAGGKNNL